MPYVNLTCYNNTPNDILLNFFNTGSLTSPLNADWVQVKRFVIPNADVPLVNWDDTTYSLTLSYLTYSVTQYITYVSYGSGIALAGSGPNPIWEIENLTYMINQTLASLVTALDTAYFDATQSHLPTLLNPYVIWNRDNSLFSLVVPYPAYATNATLTSNPITIACNTPTFHILSSIPSIYANGSFTFVFHPTLENQPYMTNYMKVDQECLSLAEFLMPTSMIITTSLPIESETIPSTYNNSNQSNQKILQDYVYDYANGLKDVKTDNIYNAPTEDYRRITCRAVSLYDIKCDVYYVTRNGQVRLFYLPPGKGASIKLQFGTWADLKQK